MSSPWWSKGLHFQCQVNCGSCCSNDGGVVFLTRDDIEKISRYERMHLKEWVQKKSQRSRNGRIILGHRDDGSCTYLGTDNRCKIHEIKPWQCQAFPWWQENLSSIKEWEKTKLNCPGIDAEGSPLVSSNTIKEWIIKDRYASRGIKRI